MPYKDPEALRAFRRRYAAANREKYRTWKRTYRHKPEAQERARAYREGTKAHKAALDKAYREANRERIRAQRKAYREANAERIRASHRAYRDQHKAARKAYDQERYTQNGAAIRKHVAAYRRANPEKIVVAKERYRRRLHEAARNDLTPAQWRTIQDAFDHRCAYCGKRRKGKLTQDHILPLSKGGSHTMSNVVPACHSCNAKKHAGPPPKPVQPLLL